MMYKDMNVKIVEYPTDEIDQKIMKMSFIDLVKKFYARHPDIFEAINKQVEEKNGNV